MKKILSISAIFVGIGLVISLIIGFFMPITAGVPKNSAIFYKFLSGLDIFIKFLPPLICTGFVVSCAVQYGRNPEGSSERFSAAMFKRYKYVMISSLIITAILTFSTEVGGLFVRYHKNRIINQPKLINEYVKVGNNLFDNGYYDRAMVYADAALKLNPDLKAAQTLKDKSDVEINRQNNINYRFRLYEATEDLKSVNEVKIDGEQILEVYNCYKKAKEYFDNNEWFNAHYYAELGKSLATPKDPNLKQLQIISTESWNNLTKQTKLAKNQDQINFDKKYEGYKALVEKDDLKAYYIFKELFETSPDLQRDPDVKFYLDIAEKRVHEKYFFIDETFELASFESATDVYYVYPYKDGSKDVIYFKGVTTVQDTGNSIQYLRNFTIESIDENGELFRTMKVPYAKVLPVDCKSISSTTKMLMGIDDKTDFVPYIMLNSVARDMPNSEVKPTFTYANGHEEEVNPDYMLLPLSYSDFLMLETVGQNPDLMPIPNLFKMVSKASDFGFSPEIFCQTLLNRLMYPILIILIVLYLAAFGWINRINIDDIFKMSWALAFPFMFIIGILFYRVLYFCFKLINFAVLGFVNGIVPAIFVVLGIQIFCFIGLSLYFCARRSRL